MAQSKDKSKKAGKPPHELPPPELVVVVDPEAGLRAGAEELTAEAVDAQPLAKAISSADAELQPLFGASEERLRVEAATIAAETGAAPPDLSVYYSAEGAKDPAALAEEVAQLDFVETAYVKPPAEPPALLSELAPAAEEPPATTPDFTSRQGYLNPAPEGIDARYAWTSPGGDGAGVRIIDIEGAWRLTHEDLLTNQGGVIGGSMSSDIGWRNHGTAVAAEFGGDRNAFGVTGISPAANTRAISIFGAGMGSGQAIRQAANALSAGDIILIELHRPGPRHNFQSRADQLGYIAVEWWPDDFDAILYATGRGVIVVEAAGNGAENLDDAIYDKPGSGFPAAWTNPFKRTNRDSGAIVVGAGAPPPGTHGRNHGPDRSRLDFSNYGALIDAQGWGREVTTCAYGDLQGGVSEDAWYTDQFSGTSSASPIVVGALASLQGFARAGGQTLYPSTCRAYLRETGSPQQASPSAPVTQRIGNRPDLRGLIGKVVVGKKEKLEKIEEKEFELKPKIEKLAKESELKRKHEKLELKEKPEKFERKEKDEKVEIEGRGIGGGLGGGKLEAEGGRGIDLRRVERLRAPAFHDRVNLEFWGKEKLEKGEKEVKGEEKDKNEKREKGEKEKDEKREKEAKEKEEKDETKENKDEKGEKDNKNEQAETLEKSESDAKALTDKETKDEKGEKDGKDDKEAKDNKNEKHDNKEKEKEEFEEIPELIFRRQGKFASEAGLHQRVGRLERMLSHFIDPKLRPDLSEGALTHESDVSKLDEEAAAAKRSKDVKDVEKPTET